MKKFLATATLLGLGVAATQAVQARYFFSLEGLSDGNDTDSAFMAASNADDLTVDSGGAATNYRLYLWAELTTAATDLKGFDLAFRSTGDVVINGGNIWQNNFVPAVTTRWNASGFPGAFAGDDPSPTVAVLEAGVTNGAFAAFDDQYDAARGAAVVGYVDVTGSNGDVHIINQGSGFLQIDPNNSILLGLDDVDGAPAEVPGQPYDNASPEFSIVPEPTSLMLLGLAALGLRRR